MKAEKSSGDELVFSNSSEEKEKYFAALVVGAFLLVVILAPMYFGEELSWFGYISFIALSIAGMILSLPEVETTVISKKQGRATLEKRRLIIPTKSVFVCDLAEVESVGVEKLETLGSKVNKMCRVVLRTTTGMNFALSSHFYRNVEKKIIDQAQQIADYLDKPISDESLWDEDDDIQSNPRPHAD
eukprot:TRINITY_DN4752_c0_g1_i1.p1 TRINITY_DN4752_c0_g1~~TRINITY_DN4752_c0_g1_i1.p1  ORF type:complete len:186 (+),score=36.26 TRINITY_DN4752_c0_g1_i1:314-871(+)